jgi:formylglycine-generating enzyme required for sulfatase activity
MVEGLTRGRTWWFAVAAAATVAAPVSCSAVLGIHDVPPGAGADDGGAGDVFVDSTATDSTADRGVVVVACTPSDPVTCTSTQTCPNGSCVDMFASCRGDSGLGTTNCGGEAGESCCTSLEVTGGTYDRIYDLTGNPLDPIGDGGSSIHVGGGPTDEADPATVSAFRLDKYLVTVGRFRQFVSAWAGGKGYLPPPGSGKHTHLNAGSGLENGAEPGAFETGWVASDDVYVAPTDSNLTKCPPDSTWTPLVGDGSHENLPIDCETWYEAYAFCIWDGGFLPSEAEWEYAAAGGSQQRQYPWGSTDPGTMSLYAIYGCLYPPNQSGLPPRPDAGCMGTENIAPVGTATLGVGRWGQLDLEGELSVWNLDWCASDYVNPCTNCAFLPESVPAVNAVRVSRAANYTLTAPYMLPVFRGYTPPTYRGNNNGIRCARIP